MLKKKYENRLKNLAAAARNRVRSQKVGYLMAKMASINKFAPRLASTLKTVSRNMRNYVGSPQSVRNVQNRKRRSRGVQQRYNYIANKVNRGSPLNIEELEFYTWFPTVRYRAFFKNLADPYRLRRSRAALIVPRRNNKMVTPFRGGFAPVERVSGNVSKQFLRGIIRKWRG